MSLSNMDMNNIGSCCESKSSFNQMYIKKEKWG